MIVDPTTSVLFPFACHEDLFLESVLQVYPTCREWWYIMCLDPKQLSWSCPKLQVCCVPATPVVDG